MEKNYTPPSVNLTSFHCPHCGTKAPQVWANCYGSKLEGKEPQELVPFIWNTAKCNDAVERFANEQSNDQEFTEKTIKKWRKQAEECETGGFAIEVISDSKWLEYRFQNIFFSICQEASCKKAALWIHDKLIIPSVGVEELPNEDMPDDVKAVYEEAREIFSKSPRAAAALLRLACEMLCKHLGAEGRSLDDKIGDLVSKGMDVRVQQILDVVRFIGNEAVHPGQINLDDDLSTAHTLFLLVNEVVQEMISKRKRFEKLYEEKLPPGVKEKIEKRNNKAKAKVS